LEFLAILDEGRAWHHVETYHYCENKHPAVQSLTDRKCPLEKGPAKLDYVADFTDIAWNTVSVMSPAWSKGRLIRESQGSYIIKVDARTPTGKRIWCLITDFDLRCEQLDRNGRCPGGWGL
jgi:hypothetical protein